MLNSVAKYLWGSSSDHEQDYTNTSRLEQQHGTGEHLETQQDEDWVVVAAAGETALGREQEETEREVVSQQREQRGEAVANESEENTVANAGQARNRLAHAAVHSGLASPQQMVQSVHSAQRVQNAKAQKLISNQKCERQNKVREYQGHAKSYNRRNKRMRPSGFRASRNTQRM